MELSSALVVATLMLVLPPLLALLVGVCLVLMGCSLLGVMWLLGEPVGSISMICLTLALGQSVDYCAHVAIAYAAAPSPPRGGADERVAAALREIARPVLAAGCSTLLGLSVLGAAESGLFRSFSKLMAGGIVLGLTHALLLLPALLRLLAPPAGGGDDEAGRGGGGGEEA